MAGEVLKNAHDLSDKQAAANEIISALNAEIPSYQRTQPAVALEATKVSWVAVGAASLDGAPETSETDMDDGTAAQHWFAFRVIPTDSDEEIGRAHV